VCQDRGDQSRADLDPVCRVLVAIAMQAVKGYFNFEVGKYLVWWSCPKHRLCTVGGAGNLYPDPQLPQIRRLDRHGRLSDFHDRARRIGFRAPSVSIRYRARRAAVGYGWPGPLLDRRLLVAALLERLRAHPAGAGKWPVAARDRDAVCAAASRLPRRLHGTAGVISRLRRDLCRIGRLHLLQYQHPQFLSHPARR